MGEDRYAEALAKVRETGKASPAYLQRMLDGMGYNEAREYVERMVREGFASGPHMREPIWRWIGNPGARITKVASSGADRPACTATVHLAKVRTVTRDWRESKAQRSGRPVDQCGLRSMYVVDGHPRCQNHAGQDAIRILMGANDG